MAFSKIPSTGELTKFPEAEYKLEWRISDIVSLVNKDEMCLSPEFSFAGAIWRGCIQIYRDCLSIGLERASIIPPIGLEVSVGFKTLHGKKDDERIAIHSITDSGHDLYMRFKCLQKSKLLKRWSDFLPSNVLTVMYTLRPQNPAEDTGESCTTASSNVFQDNKIQDDFRELFLKKEFCDVILKVKGQEFQAHKLILQARSPVLASTFQNNMKEKASGIVDIEDCDPSSFADFLCFLYCGDMKVIYQENVLSLFTAADKYYVQDLRELCLKFIKEKLSVDTFCDTFTLAIRHSETQLINLTTDFFVENAVEIIKTGKWQLFLDENPTVSNELFLKFASKSSKK